MQLVAFVIYVCFLIKSSQSIIRNDITDRCLSIGLLSETGRESVYAASCSWNAAEGINSQSYPDETLEIITADEIEREIRRDESTLYHIRKITNATNPCLTTINNEPSVSSQCSTLEASFSVDIVNQSNFKGVLTTKTSFKIRNVAGKCLTVLPGQSFLKYRDCSPRQGLFQVWSVCRHNKKCDVDFTWTPRDIIFPRNDTDIRTENINDKSPANTYPKDLNPNATAMQGATMRETSQNTVINEVLYTIQNAARIYDSSEQYLVNGIAAFYTNESIFEALSIILEICNQENLQKCYMCKQCAGTLMSSTIETVTWLLKWTTECNSSPDSKTFLSRDVFQVPHHLFPSSDPSHLRAIPLVKKYMQIIPNLKRYLNQLEAGLNDHMENKNITTSGVNGELDKPNSGNVSETDKASQYVKIVVENNNTASAQNHWRNASQDYASIIDIRLFNG